MSPPVRSPLRSTLEQREQFVGRLECAAPQMWRHDRFHGVELFCRIATRVDLGGRRIIKKKKKRELPYVSRRLKEDHWGSVPENVGRNALLLQAGLVSRGSCDVVL